MSGAPLWRRGCAAAALGALATLAMPPWSAIAALWIALPGLLILLKTAKSWRSAIGLGWLFGIGYFGTGYAWIANAFFVDGDTFGALAVPAVGGLAAGFALYIGICGLLVWWVRPRDGAATALHQSLHVVCFAGAWVLVEWWRGWFLTGLPWNPIGSVWTAALPVMQGASVFGVYGLSFATILAAASLAVGISAVPSRTILIITTALHVPLGSLATWGTAVLTSPSPAPVAGMMLRLVQPNIAQSDKWLPEQRAQHVYDQVAMSTANADGVTHVLWAETAIPYTLNTADDARAVVARASPPGGLLLSGAPRLERTESGRKIFNSLFAITPDGAIAATYDKAHLVPFGEYTPLREVIPIPQLTGGTGFSAGPGPMTLDLDGLPPVSPLVCYEVIFPGNVTADDARPAWLFNLTNDAWFGDSSGPYQHLAAAQLRAVEEGLPVIRVANTGISAVIDSRGRILAFLPLGTEGVIDHPLPGALPRTIFAGYGHLPVLTISVMGLAAGYLTRRTLSKNANIHV
jgi:apolipoprotein N-acyltransferase